MANPNIDAIKGYVDEAKLGLIGKIFNANDTIPHLNLQAGIKGATQLNMLDTSVEFADGTVCGWDPKGADTFSKRVLTPALIKVQKAWCPDVLFHTWMNNQLKYAAAGTSMTDAELAEAIIAQQVTEVGKELEEKIWTGSTESGDLFDGFSKIIKGEASAIAVETTATTVSGKILDVINALPEDAYSMGDVVVYMGKDMYRKYIQELMANGNIIMNQDYTNLRMPNSIIVPGTDVTVYGVRGLNETGAIFASYAKNFVYGTDLVEGPEDVSFKYVDYDEQYHLNIKFVAGVQVAFPSLIAYIG